MKKKFYLNLEKLLFFEIQSAARFYLREGDLENCTRVLNQLTGEPRRIVDDWIHEARLSLEVQQVWVKTFNFNCKQVLFYFLVCEL